MKAPARVVASPGRGPQPAMPELFGRFAYVHPEKHAPEHAVCCRANDARPKFTSPLNASSVLRSAHRP